MTQMPAALEMNLLNQAIAIVRSSKRNCLIRLTLSFKPSHFLKEPINRKIRS